MVLATGFGLGYLKPAPGTWGSLPPVILVLSMLWWMEEQQIAETLIAINLALVATAVAFTVVCMTCGNYAEQQCGVKDPCHVVADEVAGQSIVLLFLPWRELSQPHAWAWNLAIAATAFIAFRIADITKPPPARALQKIEGGMGVVIDDLIAGVYALAFAQIAARSLWPHMIS